MTVREIFWKFNKLINIMKVVMIMGKRSQNSKAKFQQRKAEGYVKPTVVSSESNIRKVQKWATPLLGKQVTWNKEQKAFEKMVVAQFAAGLTGGDTNIVYGWLVPFRFVDANTTVLLEHNGKPHVFPGSVGEVAEAYLSLPELQPTTVAA